MMDLRINFFQFRKLYVGESFSYVLKKYSKCKNDYENFDEALKCGFFDKETMEKIEKYNKCKNDYKSFDEALKYGLFDKEEYRIAISKDKLSTDLDFFKGLTWSKSVIDQVYKRALERCPNAVIVKM